MVNGDCRTDAQRSIRSLRDLIQLHEAYIHYACYTSMLQPRYLLRRLLGPRQRMASFPISILPRVLLPATTSVHSYGCPLSLGRLGNPTPWPYVAFRSSSLGFLYFLLTPDSPVARLSKCQRRRRIILRRSREMDPIRKRYLQY
jgi:hypothetical protein